MANNKIERKYLAHFVDAAFSGVEGTPKYVRLGQDLEEYNTELNPDVEMVHNILGDATFKHSGYEPQGDVGTFYAAEGDELWEKLAEIANERKSGDACLTTIVDVLLSSNGTVVWAYREDAAVVPTSIGDDTSGVQIPFTIYNIGNRVKGSFDMKAKTFTPDSTD